MFGDDIVVAVIVLTVVLVVLIVVATHNTQQQHTTTTLTHPTPSPPQQMMDMLSSTIFDCLIYKGYGMRTAHRQHTPGQPLVGPGFQLSLGLKDICLAQDVAHEVGSPMPFASVLHDRLLASQAKGRGGDGLASRGVADE